MRSIGKKMEGKKMETTEKKREYEICGMLRRGQTWDSGLKAHSRLIAATFLASSWFDSAGHF